MVYRCDVGLIRVQSISRVRYNSAKSYPPWHLPWQDRYRLRYYARTRLGIWKTRLTQLNCLSFRVNSIDSVRLQKINKKSEITHSKANTYSEILNHQWEDQRRRRRKNPTHDPFGNKRRNHRRMRAWFRISLLDFPQNRALLEGGALVSAVVTHQVDWIFHRRHRQDNPLTARLLPLPCWVLHGCKFAIAGGVVGLDSWQQWWHARVGEAQISKVKNVFSMDLWDMI